MERGSLIHVCTGFYMEFLVKKTKAIGLKRKVEGRLKRKFQKIPLQCSENADYQDFF